MVAKQYCEGTSCLGGPNTRLLNCRHFCGYDLELYRFTHFTVCTLFIAPTIDLSLCVLSFDAEKYCIGITKLHVAKVRCLKTSVDQLLA